LTVNQIPENAFDACTIPTRESLKTGQRGKTFTETLKTLQCKQGSTWERKILPKEGEKAPEPQMLEFNNNT
jgi:hypothetical protein